MATKMTDEEASKKPKRYKTQHQLVFFICFNWEGSPRMPEASHGSGSALQGMSRDPLLCFTRDGEKSLKVIEPE